MYFCEMENLISPTAKELYAATLPLVFGANKMNELQQQKFLNACQLCIYQNPTLSPQLLTIPAVGYLRLILQNPLVQLPHFPLLP